MKTARFFTVAKKNRAKFDENRFLYQLFAFTAARKQQIHEWDASVRSFMIITAISDFQVFSLSICTIYQFNIQEVERSKNYKNKY